MILRKMPIEVSNDKNYEVVKQQFFDSQKTPLKSTKNNLNLVRISKHVFTPKNIHFTRCTQSIVRWNNSH